ncbi:histone-fold-containing protein [Delphinella strobiligena]|nr:histone-fold-containing protein [Delphinella strobiligena]
MPSRKSNVSTATNGAEEGSPAAARAPRESTGMSVEDLSLPRTMISRLSKGVLPPNTQIQKDALSALSKSATVFVNYISSNAMDNASGAGKKTIQPQDVLVALKDTEFEFMIPRIEAELKKYNTVQCDKRNSYRRKVKADKAAAQAPSDPNNPSAPITADLTTLNSTATSPVPEADEDRPAKKIRRDDEEGDEDVDDGAEDVAEDDEGEIDEDEEMEEEEDEVADDDELDNGVPGESREQEEDSLEDEDERIQRQIERDEALDEEGGESD